MNARPDGKRQVKNTFPCYLRQIITGMHCSKSQVETLFPHHAKLQSDGTWLIPVWLQTLFAYSHSETVLEQVTNLHK